MSRHRSRSSAQTIGLWSGPLAAILMAIWWITEAIRIPATALPPMAVFQIDPGVFPNWGAATPVPVPGS